MSTVQVCARFQTDLFQLLFSIMSGSTHSTSESIGEGEGEGEPREGERELRERNSERVN